MAEENNKLSGDIEIKVSKSIAQIKALREELRKMKQSGGNDIAKVGKEVQKTGKDFSALGKIIPAIGISYLSKQMFDLWKNTVKVNAQFQTSMAKLRAISGIVGKTSYEYKKMETLIKTMGRTTQFTMVQSASALQVLKQAGLSTSAAMETLESALTIATGTGEDLRDAAETMAGTMNSFNLVGWQSSHVADIMASSFSNTNLNLERFREAMSYAGTSANLVGVSVEETTGLMGVLANNMITGTRAGTELNNLFIELNDTNGKFTKLVGGATLRTHSFAQILDIAKKRGVGFSEIMDAVGIRGGRALNVLMKNTDELKNLSESFSNATGEAQRMREELENTIEGQFKKMTSAWEAWLQAIGKNDENDITRLLNLTTDFLANQARITNLNQEIVSGFNDMVYSFKEGTDEWDAFVKVMKEGAGTSQDMAIVQHMLSQGVTNMADAQKELVNEYKIEKDAAEQITMRWADVFNISRRVLSEHKDLARWQNTYNSLVAQKGMLTKKQLEQLEMEQRGMEKGLDFYKKSAELLQSMLETQARIKEQEQETRSEKNRKAQEEKVKRAEKYNKILRDLSDNEISAIAERETAERELNQKLFSMNLQHMDERQRQIYFIEQEQRLSYEREIEALRAKHEEELIELQRSLDELKLSESDYITAINQLENNQLAEKQKIEYEKELATRERLNKEQEMEEQAWRAKQRIWNREAEFYGGLVEQMVTADKEGWASIREQFINHILGRIQGYLQEAIAATIAREMATKGVAGLLTSAVATGAITAAFGALKGQVRAAQGLASGGLVSGSGGSREDMINARLSPGEYVLDAKTVRSKGLSRIKQYHGYADGGEVSSDNRTYSITQNFPEHVSERQIISVMRQQFTYGEFRDIGRKGGFN